MVRAPVLKLVVIDSIVKMLVVVSQISVNFRLLGLAPLAGHHFLRAASVAVVGDRREPILGDVKR